MNCELYPGEWRLRVFIFFFWFVFIIFLQSTMDCFRCKSHFTIWKPYADHLKARHGLDPLNSDYLCTFPKCRRTFTNAWYFGRRFRQHLNDAVKMQVNEQVNELGYYHESMLHMTRQEFWGIQSEATCSASVLCAQKYTK